MIAWRIAIVYLILALIGLDFMLAGVPGRIQYAATKSLKANHRLVDGDVAEAGWLHRFLIPSIDTRANFLGRYVPSTIRAEGEQIELDKTLTGPALPPLDRGSSIVWMALRDLPTPEIATLDVDDTLDVCNLDGNERCEPLKVKAVACTSATDLAACSAGVSVTETQRRRVFAALDGIAKAPQPPPSPTPAAARTNPVGTAVNPTPQPLKIHVFVHHREAPSGKPR